MAIELSDKMLELANKNLYGKFYSYKTDKIFFRILNFLLFLILRIKIYLINIFRKILKLFSFLDKDIQSNIEIKTSLANNSNLIKKDVLEKGYCFLENFFNNDYYLFLNENFPKKYKFNKSKNPLKNYNIGFIYEKEKKKSKFRINPMFEGIL